MKRSPRKPPLIKIEVRLPKGSPGGTGEWMWAEPISLRACVLRNVPFYARGMSYDDHLRFKIEDGAARFVRVAKRGGHSTFRIYASKGRHHPQVNKALAVLHERMKCDLEPATEELVAIDVLPEADIYAVYSFLAQGEKERLWDFQEGHCGHPVEKHKSKSGKS